MKILKLLGDLTQCLLGLAVIAFVLLAAHAPWMTVIGVLVLAIGAPLLYSIAMYVTDKHK